jgi:hypothetical protein
MKKWAAVMVILAVALGIGFLVSKNQVASPVASPGNNAEQAAAVAAALARQSTNTVGIIESNFARVQPVPESSAPVPVVPAGPPAPLQFTNFAPATVLENMGRAVRQFGRMFGGNPVGTNPEITSQLTGKNPKHINFIDPNDGLRINGNGELIDPWGTPYFFHQISGTDMEIHSAGPDRIMWTGDDLVEK